MEPSGSPSESRQSQSSKVKLLSKKSYELHQNRWRLIRSDHDVTEYWIKSLISRVRDGMREYSLLIYVYWRKTSYNLR